MENSGSTAEEKEESSVDIMASCKSDDSKDLVVDMLSSGIVQPTDKFKMNLAKKATKLSEEDKIKIAEMVKGLAKYREMDEDDEESVISPKKVKKSPLKHQSRSKDPSDGSLQDYLKSEMNSVTASIEALSKKSEAQSHANDQTNCSAVSGSSDGTNMSGISKPSVELSEFKFNFNPPQVDLCAEFEKHMVVQKDKLVAEQNKEKPGKDKQKKKNETNFPRETAAPEDKSNNSGGRNKPPGNTGNGGKKTGKGSDGQLGRGGKVGSYTQLLNTMGRPNKAHRLEDDGTMDGQFERLVIYEDAAREITSQAKGDNKGGKGSKKKDKSKSPKHQDMPEQRSSPLPRKLSADSITSQTSNKSNRSPSAREKSKEKGPEPYPEKSKKQKKKEKKEAVAERIKSGKKTRGDEENWRSPAVSKQEVLSEHVQAPRTKPSPQPVSIDEETVVRVTVPKEDHRFIMGPQRVNLIEICNMTGVMIEVPTKKEMSEEIVLRGDKLQVGPALALMFSKCQQCKMEDMGCLASRPKENYQKVPQGKELQNQKKAVQKKGDGILDYDLVSQNKNQNANRGQGARYQNRGQGYRGECQYGARDRGQYQGQAQVPYQGQFQGQIHSQQEANLDRSGEQAKTQKSQGKRQRKKKNVFTDYLTMEEVSEGLKRGTFIQGPIRINPKQFEEAYVPHPDGKSDIFVQGLPDRNRALNTDEVAILLNEEGDWLLKKNALQDIEETHNSDLDNTVEAEVVIESEEIVEVMNKADCKGPTYTTDTKAGNGAGVTTPVKNIDNKTSGQSPSQQKKNGNRRDRECHRDRYTSLNEVLSEGSPVAKRALGVDGSEAAKKLVQRTGRVVAIIEKKHSRACTGHITMKHNVDSSMALFVPTDHRMPRLLIPVQECPKDFLERPEDHAQTLYVARLVDWRKDSVYADGCLSKSLGVAGEIEPETEGMLIENGVDFEEFPQEALDCLPETPWSIPESEYEYRRDYRQACVFTIDPATARDLDDALSCESLGDGRYKIGVHIADVSHFIPEESPLDKVAAIRATSVYLVHKVIPMLPRLLCEQLCSLNPDEDRLTFSVEWILTEDGEIEEEWFGRSVIRSCVKLAYDHAQGFIEQPDREWLREELPPISEGFSIDDIKSRVLIMDKVAKNMRKARFDGGALRLDQVKLQYSLDPDTWMPNGYSVYQQRDSNRLVEEFMLLANMAVAHKINSAFPNTALLRRHPEPKEKMIENLRDQCSTLGIQLDITSAGSLQRTLHNYCDNDEYSMARMQVLVALCAKPMQNAKYFCTGCIDDEGLYRHYALNVPLYTHFTSPIRRYPDVLVHRALGASLGYCGETNKTPQTIHRLAEHCNDKKTAAKRVGDLSSDLFFAVFVKTAGPLEEKAMVMAVFDKAFDIFVLKLGVSKRVYCNRLPIKEKIYKTDRKVPSLTLVWHSEEGEPEMRQEITIFSVVNCVLEQGELPLQWTAVIKKPTPVRFPHVDA